MISFLARDLEGSWVYEPRLARVRGAKWGTFYPGGLFGSCTFFVPHEGRSLLGVRLGFEIRGFFGLVEAYRGVVMDLDEAAGGTVVSCAGHWGGLLGVRSLEKRWADDRISQDVWTVRTNTAFYSPDMATVDRFNRIHITPKSEAWANGQNFSLVYTMPTGETIKRVSLNYDMQEAAQAWELRLRDTVGSVNIWSVTASGTGSRDDALGTPRQTLDIQFISRAAQTPPSDGTIYGEISSVMVYSETGTIDLTAVAVDIQGAVSELSGNTHLIASNGYGLGPFVTNYREFMDRILERAAGFGDSSQNPWAVGIRAGQLASDDKPVLFAEQQPILTGTPFYEVSLKDAEVSRRRSLPDVFNWVVVQYRNSAGETIVTTPDDDANLTDADSVAKYGERHAVLDLDFSSLAQAKHYAQRFLAEFKDPKYAITAPLRIRGRLGRAGGGYVPAGLVRAGNTIRIRDILPDLSGTGLVLLVTSTMYDDEENAVQVGFGSVDPLQVAVTQRRSIVSGGQGQQAVRFGARGSTLKR